MKRSIFIAVLGIGSAVAAYGQGTVNFSNYYNSSQTTGVFYGNGPAEGEGVGPEISAILLVGASTDTAISQLTAVTYSDVAGDSSPIAFGNGNSNVTGPGSVPSSGGAGWFGGGAIPVGAYGGTFAFAIEATGTYLGNVYTGYSPIAVGGNQASSQVGAPDLPATLLNGSFDVFTSVPEPTTLALAGLGGLASLIAFRRKQA